jgi:phage antirepressor YoqD-like protein
LFEELFPEKKLQIKVNGVMTTVLKSDYITPHSFIRSFVSISASKGMAVPLIAKITGKSIQVLLKHYLNASQEQAGKAMLEVWGEAPMKANKTA